MSRWQTSQSDVEHEVAKGRKARQPRPKRSPCGNPPSKPIGLTGSYDRDEGGRGNIRIRARLKWDEVTTDTEGLSSRVRDYKLEIEYSADEINWFLHRRPRVPAKEDDDPNDKAHWVGKGFHPKLNYRFRVRAIDVDGCKSVWSDYFDLGSPGAEEPPAPSNVRIFERGVDRVVMKFTLPDDLADPDEIHPDIDHCGAMISTQPDFSTIYDRDRHFRGERIAFKIPKGDRGLTFYGRVWTVDEDGRRSIKIPAWDPDLHAGVGNSDPFAVPDGVRIARGDRLVKVFTIPGDAVAKRYPQRFTADRDYDFVKIRATAGDHDPATHPDDGAPQGSPLKVNLVRTTADLSDKANVLPSDERLRVEPNTHKDVAAVGVQEFNLTELLEDEHLNVKVVSVGSTKPGTDVEVHVVLEPK